MSQAFADPKAIGLDIEALVVSQFDSVDAVDRDDARHDAVVTGLLAPSLQTADVPVVFAGTPLVEVGTHVEIKACKRFVSNGSRETRGRWTLKGRDDGQHAALLEAASVYALAVYEDDPRRLVAIAVIPATLVDEHLRGHWRTTERSEGTLAQLPCRTCWGRSSGVRCRWLPSVWGLVVVGQEDALTVRVEVDVQCPERPGIGCTHHEHEPDESWQEELEDHHSPSTTAVR
ncbi:hypothetical protein ACFQL1_06100 [Halomicroarcula sp. GCM10025709]|uniref:hypothetical protein n=1 Tax=Haloarcula TaxID=2237 RepID=UPI0024C352E6|nr:hypothetical protein [Halomicroarcula sp. YJ-61-S]